MQEYPGPKNPGYFYGCNYCIIALQNKMQIPMLKPSLLILTGLAIGLALASIFSKGLRPGGPQPEPYDTPKTTRATNVDGPYYHFYLDLPETWPGSEVGDSLYISHRDTFGQNVILELSYSTHR